jgi:hypothetical protein
MRVQQRSGFWCEHSANLKLFAAKINAIALSPVCECRAGDDRRPLSPRILLSWDLKATPDS